jgi:hypothetical protein
VIPEGAGFRETGFRRTGLRGTGGRTLLVLLAFLVLGQTADAQTRFMYLNGQNVSPAFEGWWPNDDGTFTLFFGYMNSNWEQEFDIPIGPDNHFTFTDPGGLDDLELEAYDRSKADQGQPTHFYPRRNPFLFTVRVPRDFGTTELVWTLTTRGKIHRAYASLKPDYRIDPQVISTEVGGAFGSLSDALRYNIPPELEIEGKMHVSVRVGEPLTLAATASDPDNIPARSSRSRAPTNLDQLYRPPSSVVASSGPGLRMSWIVYRGPARAVTFAPIQMKTWTDTRMYGNSPWSPPWIIPEPPPDGRWLAEATFEEPGEYVLRAVASDGSMFSYENLDVTVTP